MPRKIIDIDADVEDTYLKNCQTIMSEIINALHNHDSITIRFAEGPALEELNYKEKKFLQILKEICQDLPGESSIHHHRHNQEHFEDLQS